MSTHRETIHLEDATVLQHDALPDDQFVLRLHAPEMAKKARPGMFTHIQCDPSVPMRRPLSIMRSDPSGWIELLYKPLGPGLRLLSQRRSGDSISTLGPIGNSFDFTDYENVIAIGGGVGIPPMIFVAQLLRSTVNLTVFMGSEIEFPIELTPATIQTPGVDSTSKKASKLLTGWGVASHLASNANFAGVHPGYVTELAAKQLDTYGESQRSRSLIVACGPEPMLAACAALARKYDVACQLALEEFMACGVGGCAGCTVLVKTAQGNAMKRVCVDGPVFAAEQIYT